MATEALFLIHPSNINFLRKQAASPVFQRPKTLELAIVGVVVFVIVLGFVVLGLPGWLTRLDFSTSGVATAGSVSGIRFEDRDVSYFYVRYQFSANGQTYEREQRVPLDQFDLVLANDQALPVEYVSFDPSVSRLGEPIQNFADFLVPGTIAVIIILAMTGYGLSRDLSRLMQYDLLMKQGKVIQGKVVQSAGENPEKDGFSLQVLFLLLSPAYWRMRRRQQSRGWAKVKYQFISPLSKKAIERSETVLIQHVDKRLLPDPGTTVAIWYAADGCFKLL